MNGHLLTDYLSFLNGRNNISILQPRDSTGYMQSVWFMGHVKHELIPVSTVSDSAKCGWCNAKLHWICNQCWRCASTNRHTRTGLTLPPVGTIVCIHSTSGLHHGKTTATTTQHRSIMRLTHTHFSLTHFNTSSCAALSERNTEAQCWTSSSSKQADFTLIPGNVLHLDLPLEQHLEAQTHTLSASACDRACKHLAL